MSDIYEQHRAAFANVAAYVILDGAGERVATIAFKFPKDGAGRLYAYVHWLGSPMVRGFARGFGYDKRSAACSHAAIQIKGARDEFVLALQRGDSSTWDAELRREGFTVLQAV